jgi:hypothetical protein
MIYELALESAPVDDELLLHVFPIHQLPEADVFVVPALQLASTA